MKFVLTIMGMYLYLVPNRLGTEGDTGRMVGGRIINGTIFPSSSEWWYASTRLAAIIGVRRGGRNWAIANLTFGHNEVLECLTDGYTRTHVPLAVDKSGMGEYRAIITHA